MMVVVIVMVNSGGTHLLGEELETMETEQETLRV